MVIYQGIICEVGLFFVARPAYLGLGGLFFPHHSGYIEYTIYLKPYLKPYFLIKCCFPVFLFETLFEIPKSYLKVYLSDLQGPPLSSRDSRHQP